MTPAEARRYLRSWWGRVDRDRLRQVGIVSYFGAYALILLGARDAVNAALAALPSGLDLGPVPPLSAALGLPVSVAWSLASAVVALIAVGAVLEAARPPRSVGVVDGPDGVAVDLGSAADAGPRSGRDVPDDESPSGDASERGATSDATDGASGDENDGESRRREADHESHGEPVSPGGRAD
ncbi:hypothetical protein ACFO0N_03010 [Halobium salinum]|uniref:Cox cluster protein n=1 Tax=Halobium salinum TaxID=1364940 RepID=A0ABD5P8X8_9EURY|nr:hypothetical protein [Halobium salinum]